MEFQKIFEYIDKTEEKYLDILEDLCNIESPTACKDGVDAAGRYLLDIAAKNGWHTEIFKQDVAGDVICVTLNHNADMPPLTVSGHLDTVFPVGFFGTPAVKRDGEKMYGPGVMDCKGGIVAAFMALEALEKSGFTQRPVRIILQSDEETGSTTSGKATIKYICEKAKDSAAFLYLEGIQGDTAVIQRKGILRFLFTVYGRALHSSRCAEGANAICDAAHKIIKLEEMKDAGGLTCNCGVINGGSTPNTVAEKCCFYADIRFSTPEEAEKVRQKVLEVAAYTDIPGCRCELEEVSYRPAMPVTDKNKELLAKMNEIYGECGLPQLKARPCLSGSDAAYITESGIPCVDN